MLPYTEFGMWHLGPLKMNFYGVFFALGVFVATWLTQREAVKRGFRKELVEQLVLWMVLGMILGARLFYVLFYWPSDMPRTLYEMIAVWHGGLAFLGGFIGATFAGYLFVRKKKLRFLEWADLFIIPLVVGHILGRIGDYLTGGHPGKITTLPWGIYLDGAVRHPVVLYEIIGLLMILSIILVLRRQQLPTGGLFASYIVLYAIQRIILDIFRLESTDPRTFGLTPTQIGLLGVGIGAALFLAHLFEVHRAKMRGTA